MSASLAAAVLPAGWDRHAFLDVHHFANRTGWLQPVMEWFAQDGIFLLAVALVVAWWIGRARRSPRDVATAVWGALGALVALAVVQPIASAADETRPFIALKFTPLIHHSADAGFPSDHATAAGAVACGVFLVSRRLGVITTLLSLIIAFSRVYVGVHYPQDVLAGLALGAVIVAIGHFTVVPLMTRIADWLTKTPLRPLVVAGESAATET